MTKQNKTQKTKNTKKTIPAKKETQKNFLEYTQGGDEILTALKKTKATRHVFLKKHYTNPEFVKEMGTLANKYGYSKKAYDFMASYPLKDDLAKIKTITPFENKKRDTLSPRMATALFIAFLNRDDDATFSRVFPSGLFLENGCLTDLLTGGFIQSKQGENEKQTFVFNMKKIGGLFKASQFLKLEKAMAESNAI